MNITQVSQDITAVRILPDEGTEPDVGRRIDPITRLT
jgi:hypothetical protein